MRHRIKGFSEVKEYSPHFMAIFHAAYIANHAQQRARHEWSMSGRSPW